MDSEKTDTEDRTRDRREWAAGGDSAAVSLDGTVRFDLTRKHRSHKPQGLPDAPPATCREA